MPITSRFQPGVDVTNSFLMPPALKKLFDMVLPMGTVIDRKTFFAEMLPKFDKVNVVVDNYKISARPAWANYYHSPSTHLIIIGHILFCHVIEQHSWYYQPSTRLFTEDTKVRFKQFQDLVERAQHRHGVIPTVAKQKVTA